jgi:hypothetical protein
MYRYTGRHENGSTARGHPSLVPAEARVAGAAGAHEALKLRGLYAGSQDAISTRVTSGSVLFTFEHNYSIHIMHAGFAGPYPP